MRISRAPYLALLDTLLRAAALEDAKAVQGPDVMARWAQVAVPRWREVSAQLDAAEAAQPAETWGWYLAWRDEQHRAGRWPYPVPSVTAGALACDTPEQQVQVPSHQAAAGVEQLTL